MKKTLSKLSILLSSLFLVSCNPISTIPLETKYASYYRFNNYGSCDVFCWLNDDKWETGILGVTSRYRTVNEVKKIQDELPCPLPYMKKIISTFSESAKNSTGILIVSMPPKRKELEFELDIKDKKEEYLFLYTELNLPLPYELTH